MTKLAVMLSFCASVVCNSMVSSLQDVINSNSFDLKYF